MAGEHAIGETRVDERKVVLSIPAQPEFLRIARLAAADVGSRCGLTYEEVDDLRIAVDELCHAVMVGSEVSDPMRAGTLEIHFSLLADGVAIEATCTNEATPRLNELSAAILAAVVDEHEISGGVGGVSRFRMVKRVRLP